MTQRLIRRRRFLSLAATGIWTTHLGGSFLRQRPSLDAAAREQQWITQSQPLPEPDVYLPTDAVPAHGPKKRIAAITTAYFKYSHADDIITKFIEGYGVVGRIHNPHCDVVSLYVEQFPPSDIGRGMAARYGIPLVKTPHEALTLGEKELAVDGVLLIGEHGNYPHNDKGQHLYPRRRLYEEIVDVYRASGRSVPVFNDKHLSYSWENAAWMYGQSRELDFALMAGSSVPVTWRRPALELRPGTPIEGLLAVGYAGIESYGFHTLECLQTFAEKRRGGETGVSAVRCLEGEKAWEVLRSGAWNGHLVEPAMATIPGKRPVPAVRGDPRATLFLIEYVDGLKATAYLSRGFVSEFALAAQVRGVQSPAATWFYLPKPQRDHFSFLSNHIEKMYLTGKPSYPVERTLLVTGMLDALLESHHRGGERIQTPHLRTVQYQPVA